MKVRGFFPQLLSIYPIRHFYCDHGFPYKRKFWSSCCLSFHWLSIKFTTGFPVPSHSLWLFLCWLGWSSWSFERCSMGGYLWAGCFCCCLWILWVGSGWNVYVYIPHRKYQVKPHSSPWYSASCAAAIVHRNYFFCLYQKDKSSDSKVKFRQTSNHCKKVLETAKLAYANKKSPLLPVSFGKLQIVFSTKVNLLYLLYSKGGSCYLLHLIKQNFLLKTIVRTLIFMTQVSL